MYDMRPGTRIPRGQRSYKNRPEVAAPLSLRFFAAFTLFAIIGFIVFTVAEMLSQVGGYHFEPASAAFLVGLHFVLPLGILYTVATNDPLSRPAIAVYVAILCVAMALGEGMLGKLPMPDGPRIALSATVALLVAVWLFGSPRMRLYYALVAHRPVPQDLLSRVDELLSTPPIARKLAARIDWMADYMETIVLVGFIALVLYAWWQTGP